MKSDLYCKVCLNDNSENFLQISGVRYCKCQENERFRNHLYWKDDNYIELIKMKILYNYVDPETKIQIKVLVPSNKNQTVKYSEIMRAINAVIRRLDGNQDIIFTQNLREE